MYIYICLVVYTYIYIHIHYSYKYIFTHTCIYIHVFIYMYACMCIYIFFFAGDLIESKFDILPKFFLNPDSGFAVGDFGYHYSKAAQLGKTTQNVDECEARFKCPLSRNEFARMILT